MVLISTEAATGVLKHFEIFTGKHLDFFKIFKDTFFTEPLWMTAPILQQLLALYFAITYSRQLSSSEKSLVGENHPQSQGFYRFTFFFIFFDKGLFTLSFTQNASCTLSSQPFCCSETLNAMTLTNFQNLNFGEFKF